MYTTGYASFQKNAWDSQLQVTAELIMCEAKRERNVHHRNVWYFQKEIELADMVQQHVHR